MAKECRHLTALRSSLEDRIGADAARHILSGFDELPDSASKARKSQWAAGITRRMDSLLEETVRHSVREDCACLKSNGKSIYARNIRKLAKQHQNKDAYLAAVIEYLDGTRPLRRCGRIFQDKCGIYTILEEGRCSCSALQAPEEPVSPTWCHCCKGSIASVLREVFPDKECRIDILETCSSGGERCLMKISYL